MKANTQRVWRINNVGFPNDKHEGKGGARELLNDVAQFWTKVQMGARIEIMIGRSFADLGVSNNEVTADWLKEHVATLNLGD